MNALNHTQMIKSQIDNYKQLKTIEEQVAALKKLKIHIFQFNTLPPSKQKPIMEEYVIAREINELEMELALKQKDEKGFELGYLKAKQFYFDSKNIIPSKSEKMIYYIGLYLLHLLSNNRTTDFSTEIELIDIKDLTNPYIKVSRDLEQSIMEGNYKHLFQMKNSNDQFYNYYLGKFDDAIRFQIARSAEKSYDSLRASDAITLLMLNNANELQAFVKTQNENEEKEIDWKLVGDRILFIPLNKEKTSIPSYRIINDNIYLGIETEKII